MFRCFSPVRAALVAILVLGVLASNAGAGSLLDAIRERGVLRVGTTGDYAPFTLRDAVSGERSGFDIEQARALASAMGVKVEFVETSWPTLAADLAAGRFDIAMGGVSITADRVAKGAFSTPYLSDGKTPIARCADAGRFETVDQIDRPETRVVVNPGGTNERFARAHFPHSKLTIVPDNTRVFDEIVEGRADVMVTDATETRLQAKRHAGVLCAVHPDAPFDRAEKAYWFSRDDALKTSVDAWLARERADGSFAERARRWLQ